MYKISYYKINWKKKQTPFFNPVKKTRSKIFYIKILNNFHPLMDNPSYGYVKNRKGK